MEKIIKKFFEEISFFGGISFYLFLIILFFIMGWVNYSLRFLFALIIIYFITFLIRLIYFKPRPEKEGYGNFLEKIDASSFPSVHAARATFLCFFGVIISNNVKISLLIYVLFFLVLYSRIYLRKHYLTDVIGGVLLGLFSLVSFWI